MTRRNEHQLPMSSGEIVRELLVHTLRLYIVAHVSNPEHHAAVQAARQLIHLLHASEDAPPPKDYVA